MSEVTDGVSPHTAQSVWRGRRVTVLETPLNPSNMNILPASTADDNHQGKKGCVAIYINLTT